VQEISICYILLYRIISLSLMTIKTHPLSPHLSIYKLQITSALSILHRITGVYLFVFITLLSLILCMTTSSLVVAIQHDLLLRGMFIISLSVFIICLSYHLCTGIRYLFLSCGIGLNMQSVRVSSYIIIISTIVISVIDIWFFLSQSRGL
jgi:succinate dehydrogenase / fumarate reductase cytochrome b subunit